MAEKEKPFTDGDSSSVKTNAESIKDVWNGDSTCSRVRAWSGTGKIKESAFAVFLGRLVSAPEK